MMLAGGADKAALPRDTIFSAIMIICNGVGRPVPAGRRPRHREQTFRLEGATAALAALIALATLSLVLPAFTTSSPGPDLHARRNWPSRRSPRWCSGASSCSCRPCATATTSCRRHAAPTNRRTRRRRRRGWPGRASRCCSSRWSPSSAWPRCCRRDRGGGRRRRARRSAVIGIVIALLVLLPETWAAVRAARANRLQTSLNLALGSALASIGLTIPVVAVASVAARPAAGARPRRRRTWCCWC